MDRGVDQGPWLQERVGGGVGAGRFQKPLVAGEGWRLDEKGAGLVAFFEGCPVGWGEGTRARGGPRALVPGGRW